MGTGVQPLNDIEEVNMFKDDNTVLHFRRPQGKLARHSHRVVNTPFVMISVILGAREPPVRRG